MRATRVVSIVYMTLCKAFDKDVYQDIERAVYRAVEGDVHWAVSAAVSGAVYRAVLIDPPHGALPDFLPGGAMRANWAMRCAMDTAVLRAVAGGMNRVVHWRLSDKTSLGVGYATCRAVNLTLQGIEVEAAHPALDEFLSNTAQVPLIFGGDR